MDKKNRQPGEEADGFQCLQVLKLQAKRPASFATLTFEGRSITSR